MKRSEKQRKKGKIVPFECRVPKNSKEREESLPIGLIGILSNEKEQRKTIQWERLEIS